MSAKNRTRMNDRQRVPRTAKAHNAIVLGDTTEAEQEKDTSTTPGPGPFGEADDEVAETQNATTVSAPAAATPAAPPVARAKPRSVDDPQKHRTVATSVKMTPDEVADLDDAVYLAVGDTRHRTRGRTGINRSVFLRGSSEYVAARLERAREENDFETMNEIYEYMEIPRD